MQKIVPNLWFDKEAKEATEFYVTTFGGNSKIKNTTTLTGTPSGDTDIVSFTLLGYDFMAISAGPLFKLNPSISFIIAVKTIEEVDALWEKLSQGGKVLMDIGSYPFSERYGWIQDKYGVSWQIMSMGEYQMPSITPTLMFTKENVGKAEKAMNFYISVFKNAKAGSMMRYQAGQEPDKEGNIAHAGITLEGQPFAIMESAREHEFSFNEAISLMVNCKDQQEINYYWEKLSAVPESEQCGWLKDKYGISWQIVPIQMSEIMATQDKEKLARVTEAFLKMKKFNIAELDKAAKGN